MLSSRSEKKKELRIISLAPKNQTVVQIRIDVPGERVILFFYF